MYVSTFPKFKGTLITTYEYKTKASVIRNNRFMNGTIAL